MSPDLPSLPSTRNWREISQPVKTRAMSRGGRMRLAMAVTRTIVTILLVGAMGWGVWLIVGALRPGRHQIPMTAKSVPMRKPELQTTREGVLDQAWLARTLELPPGVSLLELDLARLHERLLADQQVLSASLTRHFPDRLKVQITERMPIARVRVALAGAERDLLVARDGIVYRGSGYDPVILASLPWLDGVALAHEGLGFRVVADVEAVARLLAAAQFSAPHLYREWLSVSLARLALDRELEVTTKRGTVVVFSAKGEFFPQLARLDYMTDRLGRLPNVNARMDLSLGREVPLSVLPAVVVPTRATDVKSTSNSPFQLRFKREF